MAIEPPPGPPAPPQTPAPPIQQQAPPPTARRGGCGARGCGFGCGGCLAVLLLAALLVVGGGWWFFVVQASAAVTAPATLIVINQPLTVSSAGNAGHPGIPGQQLNAGDSVTAEPGGHGAIQFPDGSYTKLAPGSTVQVNNVQLQRNGNVQAISLVQKVGRTFTNVQHLSSGASFTVAGHSVNAAVRGTQFEVLVRSDGTNRIWVFVGTVRVSGKTSATLHAGQEIDADASGNLSNLRSNQFDLQDPFPLAAQCASAASSAGNNPGTAQLTTGDSLTSGQSAETDYNSSGGNLNVELCYPGSLMSVTITAPDGRQITRQGPPPIAIRIAGGSPGVYKAVVRAVSVASAGEPYAIAFATDEPCAAANVDTGGVVRETLSNAQISSALAESGTSGVTIFIQGTSPSAARIVYYSDVGGIAVSWTIDFYAATPNLGAVITQVTVHDINVTTQVITRLSSFGGQSISSIPSGFVVDRVYSCTGPNGDGLAVIEGHR